MLDRSACWLALLTLLTGVGCASSFTDPTGRQSSLEEAQKRYTQLVRWGEIKRAAAFVEPELRDEFLSYAPYFEDIRITDTEAEDVKLDPSESTAAVEVTYHAYSYEQFQEKRIHERQEWTRYDGVKNNWLVRPEIGQIVGAFFIEAN